MTVSYLTNPAQIALLRLRCSTEHRMRGRNIKYYSFYLFPLCPGFACISARDLLRVYVQATSTSAYWLQADSVRQRTYSIDRESSCQWKKQVVCVQAGACARVKGAIKEAWPLQVMQRHPPFWHHLLSHSPFLRPLASALQPLGGNGRKVHATCSNKMRRRRCSRLR
jgi:hypothetical protein